MTELPGGRGLGCGGWGVTGLTGALVICTATRSASCLDLGLLVLDFPDDLLG